MNSIGDIIRMLRKARGLSQMALGDLMEVSYQQIQKYENGKSDLSVPRLTQLCEIFNVGPGVFIKVNAGKTGTITSCEEDSLLSDFRKLSPRGRMVATKIVRTMQEDLKGRG